MEIDAFASLVFQTFNELWIEKQTNVVDLFKAADISIGGLLDQEEFSIICYHLNKQNSDQSYQLFALYAEEIPDEGLNINFESFARMALERNLFTVKSQNALIGTWNLDADFEKL